MKKIEAIIRPIKLQEVRNALTNVGITGMTVSEVQGSGRQKGYMQIYRSVEHKVDLLTKVKLEIIVDDEIVDDCIQVLMEAARTGQIGDGKIFVTDIEQVYRIRTGDIGQEAM